MGGIGWEKIVKREEKARESEREYKSIKKNLILCQICVGLTKAKQLTWKNLHCTSTSFLNKIKNL